MNQSLRLRAATQSLPEAIPLLMAICVVLALLLPLGSLTETASAASMSDAKASADARLMPMIEELEAIADARTQAGSPNGNFASTALWVSTPNGHYAFVEFDLTALPADAVVSNAELRLEYVNVASGPNNVEVGRVDGAWDENTLTWDTQPSITWGGPVQAVAATGVISWDVTQLVTAWVDGSRLNYGFGLRGDSGNLVAATSKETGIAPKLIVTYTVEPDINPRPDTGDAPDSSNHHGQVNTAYLVGGIAGRFPTVYDVPANQVAGPRHANQTYEGWLGQVLSRETDADQGPDQDGLNNILRDAGGVISDIADNDRGDDGWRNRNIKFFDCREQTLKIRVSKAQNATKNRMYLNVWFDGNRDGDWADINPCKPDPTGPNQASYEWIVQDHIIDMTAIPAGGYLDFAVNTELVYNDTPGNPHWMRFSLSEDRAVQPGGNAYPDGRGPHPTSAQPGFEFGETEDVKQAPAPAGEDGQLVLQKRVITDAEPVPYAGSVTYEILLKHEGGSQPIQAEIRDELPYPLHLNRQIDDDGNIYLIEATSSTGGASPLEGVLEYNFNTDGFVTQEVQWIGTLEPDSQIKLSFEVHVHPFCNVDQNTTMIQNIAKARPDGGDTIEAIAEFEAACPGYRVSQVSVTREIVSDEDDSVHAADTESKMLLKPKVLDKAFRVRNTFENMGSSGIKMVIVNGWTGCLTCTVASASVAQVSGIDEHEPGHYTQIMELGPGEIKESVILVEPENLVPQTIANARLEPINLVGNLRFCLVSDNENQCPDIAKFPHLVQDVEPLEIEYRPADLGDAPDSSNHTPIAAGGNMPAYLAPAVQANFPTVFDPGTGLPQGPLHRHPRGLHLGRRVSLEVEADQGADQDPFNNIIPPANNPDNDRGDDGIQPGLLGFNPCQVETFDVSIFAHPAMLANLAEKGYEKVYLNAWVDGIDDGGNNAHDGDWADETTCPNATAAVEHILIDFPVDVASLNAGINIVSVTTTGPVPWDGQSEAWFRISLSEVESVKLTGKSYGDGQGPASGFRIGETEDYLLFPQGGQGDGPDIDVQIIGRTEIKADAQAGASAAGIQAVGDIQERKFKINYANRGSQPAKGASLRIDIPEALRNGKFDVRAPGIRDSDLNIGSSGIDGLLPELKPGDSGAIVLSWSGCLTCVLASEVQMEEVRVNVTLAGDVNPDNNSAKWSSGTPQFPGVVNFLTHDGLPYPYQSALTCQAPMIHGSGFKPNTNIFVHITAANVAELTTNAKGAFDYQLNVGDGRHEIHVGYSAQMPSENGLRLAVDSTRMLDPMSIRFTGPNGLIIMPDPGFLLQNNGNFSNLKLPSGGEFDISVASCAKANVQSVGFVVDGPYTVAKPNSDDCEPRGSDACGPWSAKINVPEQAADGVQAAAASEIPFSMIVSTADATEITENTIEVATTGTVRDATSSQPLESATITLLQTLGDAINAAFAVWDSSSLGQSNPQTTGADGAYTYVGPQGTQRLSVERNGYQPYTTADFASDGGIIERDILLSPEVAAKTTHTVEMTENGFEPAYLAVRPGSVVQFTNVDLDDHTATSSSTNSGWDSGLLTTSDTYKVKLDSEGTFNYTDENGISSATIVVDKNAPEVDDGNFGDGEPTIYLPIVMK